MLTNNSVCAAVSKGLISGDSLQYCRVQHLSLTQRGARLAKARLFDGGWSRHLSGVPVFGSVMVLVSSNLVTMIHVNTEHDRSQICIICVSTYIHIHTCNIPTTLLPLLEVPLQVLGLYVHEQAFGSIISASYPIEKNLKRKKPHPEEESIPWYPVELRNFPHWTVCDDIKQTILSIGPGSQRVRIIHYDPEPSLSVARAYFKKEEDRDEIREKLSDFEISPGYILKACALPRTINLGFVESHE